MEVNLAEVRRARLDMLASEFELRSFAEALIAEVETSYWDYVRAMREIDIFEESLEFAKRQLQATRDRIELGEIAAAEITAAETEVALRNQALIDARSDKEILRLRLIRLLSPDSFDEGWDLEIEVPDEHDQPNLELDELIHHVQAARAWRSEIHESLLQLENRNIEVIQTRNGLLPKLDFFVTLGKTGFADSFGDAVRNIDGDGYDVMAGIRAEYALSNRQARASHIGARASRRQAEESIRNLMQLIELDVRTAYTEAVRSKKQVSASAATRRLQEEVLRTEMEKFETGLSTVLDVALVQRDLLAANIDEAGAIIDFRKALVDLYRLDGTLMARRGIGGFIDADLPVWRADRP